MPRRCPEDCRLHHSPYPAPPLQLWERIECHARDRLVGVTSWTAAPIPWPRGQPEGRGGVGLVLTGELVRAVRLESAAAVCWWWGVSAGVVWRWRKILGVTSASNPG